jgi:hypothetical protein
MLAEVLFAVSIPSGVIPSPWLFVSFLPYILFSAVMLFLPILRRYQALQVIFLINPFVTFILALMQHDVYQIEPFVAAFCYYNTSFIQGYIDQIFFDEYKTYRESPRSKALRPIGLFGMVLLLALSSPGTSDQVGYLWVSFS